MGAKRGTNVRRRRGRIGSSTGAALLVPLGVLVLLGCGGSDPSSDAGDELVSTEAPVVDAEDVTPPAVADAPPDVATALPPGGVGNEDGDFIEPGTATAEWPAALARE